eukprot:TRINITY_DN5601_c0_g1_i5.p1 TRINITY_DN5601_c0_g1~~TRINITY_DN5601_c0_g1_i5.p1  ORF type:complete len:795 (-),score=131.06 TRINITY_DN5601_c0_g1_i5:601-2784(-)
MLLQSSSESDGEHRFNDTAHVWRSNDFNYWTRKNISCKLKGEDRPSCSVELSRAFKQTPSPNCTVSEKNLTCQISQFNQEPKSPCAKSSKLPIDEYSIYVGQSWIKCINPNSKRKRLEVSDIRCGSEKDQLFLQVDEGLLLKWSKKVKSGGIPQKTLCEESKYTIIAASSITININNGDSYSSAIIVAALLGLLVFLVLLFYARRRKTSKTQRFVKDRSGRSSALGSAPTISEPPSYRTLDKMDDYNQSEYKTGNLLRSFSVYINDEIMVNNQTSALKYNHSRFEVPRESFKLEHILGNGEFGTVYLATLYELDDRKIHEKVAVKVVKNMEDKNQVQSFHDELKILNFLENHYNLVNLVAACTISNEEKFLLLEYCRYGNLKQFLIDKQEEFIGSLSNKPGFLESEFNWNLLLTWSYSIACGMDYLVLKNIMHGDLAARNVLIGDNYSAKICDFGLSKMMYYNEDYRKTERRKIPLAWMAIEYLKTGQFNMQSDMWSFGVTLWEIFSLGNKPYGLVEYETLKKNILAGERLEAPENLDLHPDGEQLFLQVMQPCWIDEFKKRPTFTEAKETLAFFLGEQGVQAHQEEEKKYLRSKSDFENNEESSKPSAPTGYVRLESIENKKFEENDDPNNGQVLANFGGPYSKVCGDKIIVPAQSSSPGYIELSEMSIRGGTPVVAPPCDNIEKVGDPEDTAPPSCVKLSELSSRAEGFSDSSKEPYQIVMSNLE